MRCPLFHSIMTAAALATLPILAMRSNTALAEGRLQTPCAERPVMVADELPIADAKPAASVPAGVVGSWKYGSISPLWVKELNTGVISSARQMGSFYEFSSDGTFKHFVLISFNNSGWKNGTFTEEYGNASFDVAKGTVTLTVTSGKYRVMDNRVQKNNYVRDMTAEEVKKHSATVTFKLARDERGEPKLELGHGSNDGTTSYSPWKTE